MSKEQVFDAFSAMVIIIIARENIFQYICYLIYNLLNLMKEKLSLSISYDYIEIML